MKEYLKKSWLYVPAVIIALAFLAMKRSSLESTGLLNYVVLICLGYVVAIEDIRDLRVPNVLLLVMLAAWAMIRIPAVFMDMEIGLLGLVDSLLGAVTGGGLFLLVYVISRKGLGGGDVKFMAVSGLYLGFAGILPTMLIGSVTSTVYGLVMIALKKMKRTDEMPLVPFLYVGMIVTLFLS